MAEREDANPLSDPYPQSNNLKRRRDPKPGTWLQGAISSWVLPTKGNQQSDPELGAYDVPARPSALPSGYPKLAAWLDSDNTYFVSRRFAWLHSTVLLQAQEEIIRLEHCLKEQDGNDLKLDEPTAHTSRNWLLETMKRDESTPHDSRDWLLKTMKEKLSDYDSLILQMHPSAHISWSSACRYQSVREYLKYGPPIDMNYSRIRSNHWANYESVVEDVLKDPETVPWLDGPLDQDWTETLLQQKQWLDPDWRSVDDLSWRYRTKRTLEHIAGIVLWISHITSALGFVVISNASGPEGHPLLEILLACWYLSALSIVVHGLFAKGRIYARKVFLGGVSACLVGFYILSNFMRIPTASSFTAMPTIFTVVLLLIRTM